MGRKKKHEEHENHERWVISYADFITLLFAFFVVMYGMSSVNTGKYKQMVASMKVAFRVFDDVTAVSTIDNITIARAGSDSETDEYEDATGEEYVEKQLEQMFQGFLDQNMMTMHATANWVEITMDSNIMFESGSAKLKNSSYPIIRDLAKILRPTKQLIFIEGHTDDVQIASYQFPSNWELSTARASAVVRQLVDYGVNPKRLVAMGFAHYNPKVKNTDENARSINRRVSIVISKKQSIEDDRQDVDDIDLQAAAFGGVDIDGDNVNQMVQPINVDSVTDQLENLVPNSQLDPYRLKLPKIDHTKKHSAVPGVQFDKEVMPLHQQLENLLPESKIKQFKAENPKFKAEKPKNN